MRAIYVYREWHVREDMLAALTEYVEHGIPLGGFLECIVCNDFVHAAGHADAGNLRNLQAYADWLYYKCPVNAWGNEATYRSWLAMHAVARRSTEGPAPAPQDGLTP